VPSATRGAGGEEADEISLVADHRAQSKGAEREAEIEARTIAAHDEASRGGRRGRGECRADGHERQTAHSATKGREDKQGHARIDVRKQRGRRRRNEKTGDRIGRGPPAPIDQPSGGEPGTVFARPRTKKTKPMALA
jgi:hypothetical protein